MWLPNYGSKRTSMPNETIVAKETEKQQQQVIHPRYCSNTGSSASVALNRKLLTALSLCCFARLF